MASTSFPGYVFNILYILLCLNSSSASAQANQITGAPLTLDNMPQRDTAKTLKNSWNTGNLRITYRTSYSNAQQAPDTSIHLFHRRPYTQPWFQDLGNLGTPVRSLFYRPRNDARPGLSLGYHAFEVYRFNPDSLVYYQTNRPYSMFRYQQGGQQEQLAQIMHTQNITRNWNAAFIYRKTTSPGFYKIQRANHDNAALNSHYRSNNQQYELFAAMVYNRQQQDENGGIIADSFLTAEGYGDRGTIQVALENNSYSVRRSSVRNNSRDFRALLNHRFSFGLKDTLYNADSTKATYRFTPRFGLAHRLDIGDEILQFKHYRPDSIQYVSFFNRRFNTADSIYTEQGHRWVDNYFSLNGFFGKAGNQLQFTAGAGSRIERFYTDFINDRDANTYASTYISGSVLKEAADTGQWLYSANARLYLTGPALGNFLLQGEAGKDVRGWGRLVAGIRQSLSEAPYNFSIYQTNYYRQTADLSPESNTELYAQITVPRVLASAGMRNRIVTNYIYAAAPDNQVTNGRLEFRQEGTAFNMLQVWLSKTFRFGAFVLDNEVVLQQIGEDVPVNLPLILARQQLSAEGYILRRALKVAAGVEARYHTPYYADGYAPFYNRFYYQEQVKIDNKPAFSVFMNFKVKRLRAYVMGDQVQNFFWRNNFSSPGYPLQDFNVRFGFDWVLVN